jgi:hypothetical protein
MSSLKEKAFGLPTFVVTINGRVIPEFESKEFKRTKQRLTDDGYRRIMDQLNGELIRRRPQSREGLAREIERVRLRLSRAEERHSEVAHNANPDAEEIHRRWNVAALLRCRLQMLLWS